MSTRIKKITLYAFLAAIMFSLKMSLVALPNIEPVSTLVIVYAICLGLEALIPIYIYVLLEFITWGFGLWSLAYLYVWLVLFLVSTYMRKMAHPLGWALISGIFGLSFGALCSIVYLIAFDANTAISWWISGIPMDIVHGIGNFSITLVLFKPLKYVFTRSYRVL